MHRLIEEGAHPCVAGLLTDSMVKILTRQGQDFIAEVDFVLGKGTMRPYWIHGQLIMIPAETYDMVVFSLLREMYGLGFPKLMIVNFTNFQSLVVDGEPLWLDNAKFIVSKRFNDRDLRVKDYHPATKKNRTFRFRLCLLIYFCKFVGVDFDLRHVRVINDNGDGKVPFLWRVGPLGHRNAKTVDATMFANLFGVDFDVATRIYSGRRRQHNEDSPPPSNHGSDKRVEVFNNQLNMLQNDTYVKANPHDSSKLKLGSQHPDPVVRNIIDTLKGLKVEKTRIEELIDRSIKVFDSVDTSISLNGEFISSSSSNYDVTGSLMDMTDARLTSVVPREVDYGQLKGSMFDEVVNYFRSFDFDTDILRSCIYLRDNPVRSARGNRCKFKLARGPEMLQKIIEENYVLLSGPYPFKIFRIR
jgi:hypothetical protein